MTRRAKGEGSIYKRSDGKYVVSVVAGHRMAVREKEDGSVCSCRVARRKRTITKTKSEALKQLQRLLAIYNPNFASELLVSDYLNDWLTDGVDRWRRTTYETYETWARLHIQPFLGTLKVCSVTAEDVRNWQRELADRGVSVKTRARAHKLMSEAFGHLVDERRAPWNPFKAVKPPKEPRANVFVPNHQQLQRLIKASEEDQVRAIVVLAVTTLLRIGELLALRLQDVDLARRNVRVTATLSRDWNGDVVRGEPKTRASRRVVSLPRIAVRALRRHLQSSRASGIKTQWLFAGVTGEPLNRNNFRNRIWIPLLKIAKLPPNMHFHSLRHAGTSLLLEAGVPVLVIAARCGHADTRMTLDRYGHIVLAGADKEAARATDRIFHSILGLDA